MLTNEGKEGKESKTHDVRWRMCMLVMTLLVGEIGGRNGRRSATRGIILSLPCGAGVQPISFITL